METRACAGRVTAPTVSLGVPAWLEVNSVQRRDRLRYRGQARAIPEAADPIVRLVSGKLGAPCPEGGYPR